LHYYFERFDVPLKRQTILDMLCFIYDRNGFGKLEAQLTRSELEEQVLKNFKSGLPFNGVLRNHLKYCLENRVFRAFPYALEEILRTGSDGEAKRIALSLLLKDDIGLRMLISEIGNICEDFRWEVINAIIEINPAEIRGHLQAAFRSDNYDQQIKACLLLITLQDIEALTFYIQHIKEANSFDKIAANECTLRKLRSKHAIPALIDLLRLSLQDDFIQTDDFARLERIVLDSLKAIGSVSEENYLEVKSEVTKFVKKESIHNQKAFWINVFLEQLDHQYYIQKISILNVEDVIARMKIIEKNV